MDRLIRHEALAKNARKKDSRSGKKERKDGEAAKKEERGLITVQGQRASQEKSLRSLQSFVSIRRLA